jgi:hypothetical protein
VVFGCWIMWIDKGAATTPDQHARNSFCLLGALVTWLPTAQNGACSSLGAALARIDRETGHAVVIWVNLPPAVERAVVQPLGRT